MNTDFSFSSYLSAEGSLSSNHKDMKIMKKKKIMGINWSKVLGTLKIIVITVIYK